MAVVATTAVTAAMAGVDGASVLAWDWAGAILMAMVVTLTVMGIPMVATLMHTVTRDMATDTMTRDMMTSRPIRMVMVRATRGYSSSNNRGRNSNISSRGPSSNISSSSRGSIGITIRIIRTRIHCRTDQERTAIMAIRTRLLGITPAGRRLTMALIIPGTVTATPVTRHG